MGDRKEAALKEYVETESAQCQHTVMWKKKTTTFPLNFNIVSSFQSFTRKCFKSNLRTECTFSKAHNLDVVSQRVKVGGERL